MYVKNPWHEKIPWQTSVEILAMIGTSYDGWCDCYSWVCSEKCLKFHMVKKKNSPTGIKYINLVRMQLFSCTYMSVCSVNCHAGSYILTSGLNCCERMLSTGLKHAFLWPHMQTHNTAASDILVLSSTLLLYSFQ